MCDESQLLVWAPFSFALRPHDDESFILFVVWGQPWSRERGNASACACYHVLMQSLRCCIRSHPVGLKDYSSGARPQDGSFFLYIRRPLSTGECPGGHFFSPLGELLGYPASCKPHADPDGVMDDYNGFAAAE